MTTPQGAAEAPPAVWRVGRGEITRGRDCLLRGVVEGEGNTEILGSGECLKIKWKAMRGREAEAVSARDSWLKDS